MAGYAQSSSDGYFIGKNFISYNDSLMSEADVPSFTIMGHGYAKDNRHVYLNGKVLEYADPATFSLTDRMCSEGTKTEDATKNARPQPRKRKRRGTTERHPYSTLSSALTTVQTNMPSTERLSPTRARSSRRPTRHHSSMSAANMRPTSITLITKGISSAMPGASVSSPIKATAMPPTVSTGTATASPSTATETAT